MWAFLNALKNDSIIIFHEEKGTQIIYMKKKDGIIMVKLNKRVKHGWKQKKI